MSQHGELVKRQIKFFLALSKLFLAIMLLSITGKGMAQTVPYTLVGNFNGYNGNVPNGLVLGPDGAIYGTTARGGASGGDVERGVLFDPVRRFQFRCLYFSEI